MPSSFALLLVAAALVGMGSAVFHPEASRVARMASGGQHGLAQSLFQVGGNIGSSLGPLLAAFIVMPRGQGSIAWFSLAALLAMVVLARVGTWYKGRRVTSHRRAAGRAPRAAHDAVARARSRCRSAILLALIFSKYFYTAGLTNFYTFYLIDQFRLPVATAQIYLFVFLASVALGTLLGGPIGDRIGRKYVIWVSILGVLPVHPGAALRRPVLDRRADRADRRDHGVGLLGHPGLCAGADARPGRHGRRHVLRLRLRHGGHRRRRAGLARRPHQHRATSIESARFLPLIGLLTVFLPDIERRRRALAPEPLRSRSARLRPAP